MNKPPKPTKDQTPPQESPQESPPPQDHIKELESLGLNHLLPERPPERPTRKLQR